MKALIAELEAQIESISSRATTASRKANKAVIDKNRAIAVSALKSQKIFEQTLMKRYEMLSKLEDSYNKLEQATDQVAMVRVMAASADVLSNLYEQSGGIERVGDVIDRLRDEVQKVDEASSAIQTAGHQDMATDNDMVDEEFERLLHEPSLQAEKRRASYQHNPQEELLSAPKVPSQDPITKEANALDYVSPNIDSVTEALKQTSLENSR